MDLSLEVACAVTLIKRIDKPSKYLGDEHFMPKRNTYIATMWEGVCFCLQGTAKTAQWLVGKEKRT